MSAVHAPVPVRRPQTAGASPRPRLQVVATPEQSRTRVPFILLCVAVLVAAMLGALLLNTSMAQGEYERRALQAQLVQSVQAQQQMLSELERAASPVELARAADELGMVPATGGYLRLADGVVLGDPSPAEDE